MWMHSDSLFHEPSMLLHDLYSRLNGFYFSVIKLRHGSACQVFPYKPMFAVLTDITICEGDLWNGYNFDGDYLLEIHVLVKGVNGYLFHGGCRFIQRRAQT